MRVLRDEIKRRPRGPWIIAQSWEDLLFAHWPLKVEELRRLVPASLPLDTFEEQGWVSIVPFWMSGIRGHWLPPLPGLSASPELNVRTYVTLGGKPGVFFFSLDITKLIAVPFGRLVYHLPYYHAAMTVTRGPTRNPQFRGGGPSAQRRGVGGEIRYASRRVDGVAGRAEFRSRYGPVGAPFHAPAGTLDDWLTARFCLYSIDGRGRVYRADIRHQPWPLQAAKAEIELNTMTAPLGLSLSGAPLLHFARRVDVRIWPPTRVAGSRPV